MQISVTKRASDLPCAAFLGAAGPWPVAVRERLEAETMTPTESPWFILCLSAYPVSRGGWPIPRGLLALLRRSS